MLNIWVNNIITLISWRLAWIMDISSVRVGSILKRAIWSLNCVRRLLRNKSSRPFLLFNYWRPNSACVSILVLGPHPYQNILCMRFWAYPLIRLAQKEIGKEALDTSPTETNSAIPGGICLEFNDGSWGTVKPWC